MSRFLVPAVIDIYCITAPSGRQYVGLASAGFAARWRSHTFDARHGSRCPLHAAIRKYGPGAFDRRVLERCATRAEATIAERKWIARLGTHVRCGGYNATLGGDGTHGLSDEARARISVASTGRVYSAESRARMSAAHIGQSRRQTPEHRARIAAANKGKQVSRATRAKLRVHNLGKTQSAETKAKRSVAMKAAWARRSAEQRADVCRKISRGKFGQYPRLRIAVAWSGV